jgi:hypothetical protein
VLNASALAENYHTSDITTDGASLHASLSGFINVSASASPNGDDTATEASGYGYERTQIIFTLSDPSLVTFQASTTFSSSFGSVNYNVITLRNYLVNTNQGSIYDDGGATYARYGAAYDGFGNLTTYPSSGSISIELQPGSYIAEARASFGSFAQYNFDPGPHSDADSGSFSMLLDVAAVPEPSQYAAGISCLCALLAFQRRAKK